MKHVKSADDGWCFFRSLLKGASFIETGIAPESNRKSLSPEIVRDEILPFVAEIVIAVKEDPMYDEYSMLYMTREPTDTNDATDSFEEYLDALTTLSEDGGNSAWADPDYGIAKAAADILHTNIAIYKKVGQRYERVIVYEASDARSLTPIYILYVNGNHYDALLPLVPYGQFSMKSSKVSKAASRKRSRRASGRKTRKV